MHDLINKIAELTEERPNRIAGETVLHNLEAWDSLAMVSFMVYASTEFGVKINGQDLQKAITVSDLCRMILEKKNDASKS